MVDFSALKKKKGSNLKKMAEKLEDMNQGGGSGGRDERIYKPGFDKKEGIGNAVIRLLPAKDGDNFVRQFSHSFKGKGGFYWENSRSTLEEKDPVGISNGAYWRKGEETGDDRYKNIARSRKRQTKYYFNVYVEKDSNNPEAEGKVMIMECGPQIFGVIEKAIKPKFEDEEPIDPFDLWDGAPLKIRAEGREIPDRNTGNKIVVPNYEESKFGNRAEFMDGDEDKMKEVFEQTYDLSEFIECKSFDELAKRFKQVTGEAHDALENGDSEGSVDEETRDQVDKLKEEYQQSSSDDSEKESEDTDSGIDTSDDSDDDDDDILAEFQRIANS